MPYYREEFVNRSVPVSVTLNGATTNSGLMVQDSTELMGFRARPHSNATYFQEVQAISADPYAYFLDLTSTKKYHARLKERGLQPKGEPDRGHAFELKRHTIDGHRHNLTRIVGADVKNRANCLLSYFPPATALDSVFSGTLTSPAPYQESGLDAFAQQAFVRTAPTSVVFDAAQFLGELREGLPGLIPAVIANSSRRFAKNLGKDYLNVQFGWKPFLNDLQNIGKALAGSTEMLSTQGQRVHRRYGLPVATASATETSTASVSASAIGNNGFATHLGGTSWADTDSVFTGAEYTLTKQRRSERWFEGEFTSFYPLGFDPTSYFERLNVLVNPKITPATLWALAPWSWLVDWSLHIEDSIRANEMSANDLLVMHYGYAMETVTYKATVNWRSLSAPRSGWNNVPTRGFVVGTTQYKRRLRANPYGFRVGGGSSLTGNQAAILGALGLTKFK